MQKLCANIRASQGMWSLDFVRRGRQPSVVERTLDFKLEVFILPLTGSVLLGKWRHLAELPCLRQRNGHDDSGQTYLFRWTSVWWALGLCHSLFFTLRIQWGHISRPWATKAVALWTVEHHTTRVRALSLTPGSSQWAERLRAHYSKRAVCGQIVF